MNYYVQCNKLGDDSHRFYVLETDAEDKRTGNRWKVSVTPKYKMVEREFEDRRDVDGEKGQVFINTEEVPELLTPDFKAVAKAFNSLDGCPKVTDKEVKDAYEYVPEPGSANHAVI